MTIKWTTSWHRLSLINLYSHALFLSLATKKNQGRSYKEDGVRHAHRHAGTLFCHPNGPNKSTHPKTTKQALLFVSSNTRTGFTPVINNGRGTTKSKRQSMPVFIAPPSLLYSLFSIGLVCLLSTFLAVLFPGCTLVLSMFGTGSRDHWNWKDPLFHVYGWYDV